jgi:hypothetical protein
MPAPKYFLILIALLSTLLSVSGSSALAANLTEEDKTALIILNYSRIDESYAPESNLTFERFEQQITKLKEKDYRILSLSATLDTYDKNQPLPQKAIAITFEGAYKSTLKNAIPLLLENNIPFTVFYAADRVGDTASDSMNWDDLKRLHKNPLVTLGVLPASYKSLTGQDKAAILADLNRAKAKHRDRDLGYRAAIAMNSGPASARSDRFALPRFSITEEYGDPDHFNTIINTLPMGVSAVEPPVPVVTTATPTLGFTLPAELESVKSDLQCFTAGQPKPAIEFIGNSRIELRLAQPLTDPRTRINCILPVKAAATARETDTLITNWRWLGFLLMYQDIK